MKLKTIKPFFDLEENVDRNVGDVFEADEKRAAVLMEHAFGALVAKVAPRTPKKQAVNADE